MMDTTVTLPLNCGSAQVFVHTESATHVQTMTLAASAGGGAFTAAVALPPEDLQAPPYFELLLDACRGGTAVADRVCEVLAAIPEPTALLGFTAICSFLSGPVCYSTLVTAYTVCSALPAGASMEPLCDIVEDVQKALTKRGEPQYPVKIWATAKTDGQEALSTSGKTLVERPAGEMSLWIDSAQCCQLEVSSQQLNVAAQGGKATLQVRANYPTCPWSVVADNAATWATPAPLSGVGTGAVVFTVAENKGDTRVAPFFVAGKGVTIAQVAATTANPPSPPPPPPPPPPLPSPCVIELGSQRQEISSSGGSQSLSVEVGVGCAWSARSSASWLKVANAAGVGSGTIIYEADRNTGAAPRSATITVGSATAEIVQAAQSLSCLYGTTSDLAPKVSATGGRTTVKVVSSNSILCPIVPPVTGESWITLSPTVRLLDGAYQFTYSVAANTGAARRGWIRLANITIAIEQAGVPTQPPPASGDSCEGLAFAGGDLVTIGAAGGMASVSVSAPAKCSWVVSSVASSVTDPWLSTTRRGSVIQYSAKQNSTGAKRAGFITIKSSSGKVERRLVVMQEIFSWMACRFGFSPWNEVDAPAEGLSRTIQIDANFGLCDARVVPLQLSDPWLSASPLSNVIPGRWTMQIGVASNPGPTARDGFLIVMNAVFWVHQAGKAPAQPPPPANDPPVNPPSCVYRVSPTTIVAPTKGGTFPAKVTASCAWQASVSITASAWLKVSPVSGGSSPITTIVGRGNSGGRGRGVIIFGNGGISPISGGSSTLITIDVQANRGGRRSGTITIGDKVITIDQRATEIAPPPPENPPPCTYGVSPTAITAPREGGEFIAQVTTSCAWHTSVTAEGWLQLSPVSSAGSAPITIYVQANSGANRSNTITIGDKAITINQEGTVVEPPPPPVNGGSCGIVEPSRTEPRFVSAASLPADGARGIAIACPSGDVLVAGQRGSSAVIAKLDTDLATRAWLVNREGIDVRGLAVPPPGEPTTGGAVYAAGIATLGQCGASDGVGSPEGKSVLSVLNAATGAETTCGSQTVFPYAGYEMHLAITASNTAVFTAGLYETCGFGHHVNVLTHYDLAGKVVARASEPGVDFGGYSCIGSSVGNAIANGDGALFVAGSSALSEEGDSRAFVTCSTGLVRSWKTRSAFASDFAAVTWDAGAVYAAGVCAGQACIEKFDAALGTSLWKQTYGSPGSRISGIVAPGNGHIYAVGLSEGSSTDALLIGIAGSTGAQTSVDLYDSGGNDAARGIVSSGGDLYMIGDTVGENAGVFVRRYQLNSPQ